MGHGSLCGDKQTLQLCPWLQIPRDARSLDLGSVDDLFGDLTNQNGDFQWGFSRDVYTLDIPSGNQTFSSLQC